MKTFLILGFGFLLTAGWVDAQQVPAQVSPMPMVKGQVNGPSFIGHRFCFDRYVGWGWVRPETEKNWKKARWVIMQETPGVISVPNRSLPTPDADNNVEYRLWGEFAPYKGYETNYDIFTDVFILKGYQVLGQASPLKLKPPVMVNSGAKKMKSSPMSRGE